MSGWNKQVNWLFINRVAGEYRLVIPGWSMLPTYFDSLFPNENLIILNEFANVSYIKSRYAQEIKNETMSIRYQTLEQLLLEPIADVFIFSMGFQWTSVNAPMLFEFPCILAAPSLAYESHHIDQMIKNIQKSKTKALTSFYRQGCSSGWGWWKSTHFQFHLESNCSMKLTEWLEIYGRKCIQIPNKDTITIVLSKEDPIGIKPEINHRQKIKVKWYSGGHILTPQQIAEVLH